MPKSNISNFSVSCSPKTKVVWSCQSPECFIALESYVKNVNFDKIVTLGHRNSTFLKVCTERWFCLSQIRTNGDWEMWLQFL